MGQATLHFPPLVESEPLQRKALRLLSSCSIVQAEREQQMDMCTRIADSVDLVSVSRPALLSRPAFQVGIRMATESMSFCSSERRSLERERGAPR